MATSSAEDLELGRLVLEQITSKWTLLILSALCHQPLRFNGLRRALPSVTQKALTQSLRRLEASGFISRNIVSTSPVAVVYEIAPLGQSLEPHLQGLLQWAIAHRREVLEGPKLAEAA